MKRKLLQSQLEIALINTEKARDTVKKELEELQKKEDMDMGQLHLLVNYKLELLDLKLRLKDMLEHLHLLRLD
jgi:hypothetical protein